MPLEAQTAGQDALTAKFDLGERLGGSRTGAVHRAIDAQERLSPALCRPCSAPLKNSSIDTESTVAWLTIGVNITATQVMIVRV